MQKVLWIIGVCALGAFVSWKSAKSNPMVDELLLKNVEALADLENPDYYYESVKCLISGDSKCPNKGIKVKYIIEGLSLGEDEETY